MRPTWMYLVPLVTALACSDGKTEPEDTGLTEDTGATDTDTEDTEDTDTEDTSVDNPDTGVETPDSFWTEGPALPECTPQDGSDGLVALSGVVLSLDGPVAGVVQWDPSTGIIECVGAECDVSNSTVVCSEGVISPGLIDAHDHMQYNALKPWQHAQLFENRYHWQSNGAYYDYREAYDGIANSHKCEIGRWAELRALVGGGTAAVGSSGGSCLAGMVRNLDEDEVAHYIQGYDLKYSSGRVTNYDADDAAYFNSKLEAEEDYYGAVMNHVAEGIGGSVSSEIEHMFNIGMAGPGMVFVHATDASTEQLAKMRAAGTTILWSPRSNLDLYAATTQADVARRMSIPVALGPDWTWSGSMNPVRENLCAKEYFVSRNNEFIDQDVWEMSTTDAARAVGLDGVLGALAPGMMADLAVFTYSERPYQPVIDAEPESVLLTVVNGEALYGHPDLMNALVADQSLCEAASACGEDRTFCVRRVGAEDGYEDLEISLTAALDAESMPTELQYAKELLGLWMCEETRADCDISQVADGDSDGDGAPDDVDTCPDSYNPLQKDYDMDGLGDSCDTCPLVPNSSECAHAPEDVDDDGVLNEADVCPWLHDPSQADNDGDGVGDACDCQPENADPDAACPFTIFDIQNPNAPNHPNTGAVVEIQDVVVVAGQKGYGFTVQDPDGGDHSALLVYGSSEYVNVAGTTEVCNNEVDDDQDGLDDFDDPDCQYPPNGTVVTVSGEYVEWYSLAQLTNTTVTITGEQDPIEPLLLTDVCAAVADGEPLENMYVKVENVAVTNQNADGPDDDYNEFEVGGCLRIDDQMCPDCWADQPAVGTSYSEITGVFTYTFGNYKLLPASAADLVE